MMEHQQPAIMQNINGETVHDELPEAVIIEEILVRLRAEDILRCRVVRKYWHHATSTHNFLLAHHQQQPSLPVIDIIKCEGEVFDHHLFVFCDASPGAANCKLSQKTIFWYPSSCPYSENLVIHGSCDGLLVVSYDKERLFDVCNPSTLQHAPVPLLCDQEHGLRGREILIAGFYQHRASGEYRVMYSIWTSDDDFYASTTVDFRILAVGSNELRPIRKPPLQQGLLDGLTCSKNAPVLHRGNLHWLLERHYTSYDFSNIIMFDTTVETFRWMKRPPPQYSWMSLIEMNNTLSMCSRNNGIIIDIYVMRDYEAEVWALTHKINLSVALKALPRLFLPARILCKIVTLNKRELLIKIPGCILHYDIDGMFLGKMECDEAKGNHMHITSFRFQENIVPLPFFGMQEDHSDSWMLEEGERDDDMQYSIWP